MSERDVAMAEIVAIAERHGLTADEVSAAIVSRRSGVAPVGASAVSGPTSPLASAVGGATAAHAFEGATAREVGGPTAPRERASYLARALAYLGGVFVLSGLVVFVGMFWDQMNSVERIVVTLGSGLATFVLAYLAHQSPKREQLATPLFLIAVMLEPTGIVVAFGELSSGGEPVHALFATSLVMVCQCLLFFARVRRGIVLLAALVFTGIALASLFEMMDVDGDVNGLIVGTTCFLLTRAIQRSGFASVMPLAYFASATLMLASWYEVFENGALEPTTALVACGFVYLSVRFKSRTLLAAGCLGLLVYLGYYTGEHFADSLGWPLALILVGILMMALGTAAVRIHKKYIRTAA